MANTRAKEKCSYSNAAVLIPSPRRPSRILAKMLSESKIQTRNLSAKVDVETLLEELEGSECTKLEHFTASCQTEEQSTTSFADSLPVIFSGLLSGSRDGTSDAMTQCCIPHVPVKINSVDAATDTSDDVSTINGKKCLLVDVMSPSPPFSSPAKKWKTNIQEEKVPEFVEEILEEESESEHITGISLDIGEWDPKETKTVFLELSDNTVPVLPHNTASLIRQHTPPPSEGGDDPSCVAMPTANGSLQFFIKKEQFEMSEPTQNAGAAICEICGKMFPSERTLSLHTERMHTNSPSSMPYKCAYCLRSCGKRAKLLRHLTLPKGPCEVCGEVFICVGQMIDHKRESHHVQCQMCKAVFATATDLNLHKMTKHKTSNGKKNISCPNCAKTFAYPSYLKAHLENFHSQTAREYKCEQCDYCTDKRGYLAAHKNRMHSTSRNSKRHICNTCFKSFSSNARVQEHMRIHTGERPYSCPLCFKTFYSASNLYAHERSVHGLLENYGPSTAEAEQVSMRRKRPSCYKCVFCDEMLPSHRKLTEHIDNIHPPNGGAKQLIPTEKTKPSKILKERRTRGVKRGTKRSAKCASPLVHMWVPPGMFSKCEKLENGLEREEENYDQIDAQELANFGEEIGGNFVRDLHGALTLPAHLVPPDYDIVEIDGLQYHVIRNYED